MNATNRIVSGTFFGADLEPGTFHGGKVEPGVFHREQELPPHMEQTGSQETPPPADPPKPDAGPSGTFCHLPERLRLAA